MDNFGIKYIGKEYLQHLYDALRKETYEIVEDSQCNIKPLQRRNGLVVLANANKSAVPRVHGWPGKCLFSALSDLPCTHTPLAQIGYAH